MPISCNVLVEPVVREMVWFTFSSPKVGKTVTEGAATSFVSVKDLLVKGAKKRKKPAEFDESACEDDEDDEAIMAGFSAPRRTTSLKETSKASKAKKPRRAATVAGASKEKKTTKPRKKKSEALATAEMSASQLDMLIEDDSDDKEIGGGFFAADDPYVPLKPTLGSDPRTPPSSPERWKRRGSPSPRLSSSPEIPLNVSIIDLTTPDVGSRPTSLPQATPPSPARALSNSRSCGSASDFNDSPTMRSPTQSRASDRPDADPSLAWLIADDDDPEIQFLGSSPTSAKTSSSKVLTDRNRQDPDDSIEFVEDYVPPSPSRRIRPRASPPKRNGRAPSQEDMPPPALPLRFSMQSAEQQYAMPPPPTFAIRAPGNKFRKRSIPDTIGSSPAAAQEPVPKRSRLQRHRDLSSSPPPASPQSAPRKKKRIFKDAAEAARHNPWVEYEAEHSGDDRSVGTSGPEDMDEYEASFVQDVPETQLSPSYDQSAIYRQSLLSQVHGRTNAPLFARRPSRHEPPMHGASGPSRRRHVVSSSPKRTDEEPDEYVFGSFVVDDDDEDLLYAGQSSDI